MSEFVEVKTAELVGPALDWCVAEADGLRPYPHKGGFWVLDGKTNAPLPKFSTDWAQGGPLIDKYDIWISSRYSDEGWMLASLPPHTNDVITDGETRLIAVCRALVISKLGKVVQVPVELVGVVA